MALESATYISELVKTNPADSDAVGQGDDHLRMIKDVLKTNFSGLNSSGTTAVTASATELNLLDGVTTLAPEGTAVLSTGETGATKFLREDGDNTSSWQVPTDTNTTYTAGDGLDLTGTAFSTDLKSGGGLAISSAELTVDFASDNAGTGSQRGTPQTITQGTLIDLDTGNNFLWTPAAADELSFDNETAGQSGFIKLINPSAYVITKGSEVKASATFLADVTAAGTYLITYFCDSDAGNVYVSASAALS